MALVVNQRRLSQRFEFRIKTGGTARMRQFRPSTAVCHHHSTNVSYSSFFYHQRYIILSIKGFFKESKLKPLAVPSAECASLVYKKRTISSLVIFNITFILEINRRSPY
jgi:hypothetical protein